MELVHGCSILSMKLDCLITLYDDWTLLTGHPYHFSLISLFSIFFRGRVFGLDPSDTSKWNFKALVDSITPAATKQRKLKCFLFP